MVAKRNTPGIPVPRPPGTVLGTQRAERPCGSVDGGAAFELDDSLEGPISEPPPSSIPNEAGRSRMISELTCLVADPEVPDATKRAGLTLIGWLARRMPGEEPHALGVDEARESERRLRAAKKLR
jgi:hypothetical protein